MDLKRQVFLNGKFLWMKTGLVSEFLGGEWKQNSLKYSSMLSHLIQLQSYKSIDFIHQYRIVTHVDKND
jgi:hypothetical protein